MPYLEEGMPEYKPLIIKLEEEIQKIEFKAKKAYLFIAPLNRIIQVQK